MICLRKEPLTNIIVCKRACLQLCLFQSQPRKNCEQGAGRGTPRESCRIWIYLSTGNQEGQQHTRKALKSAVAERNRLIFWLLKYMANAWKLLKLHRCYHQFPDVLWDLLKSRKLGWTPLWFCLFVWWWVVVVFFFNERIIMCHKWS